MNIIKYYDSIPEDALSCDDEKDYALFAVSSGAVTAIRKTFENAEIRKHVHFFKCDSQSDYNLLLEEVNIAMKSDVDEILKERHFKKAIIVSTLGGRTGTEYPPILSKLLAENGLELKSIVTLPFGFEGKGRLEKSQTALIEMSRYAKCATLFNLDNLKTSLENRKVADFFSILFGYIEKAVINYVL